VEEAPITSLVAAEAVATEATSTRARTRVSSFFITVSPLMLFVDIDKLSLNL
jgi:hypothetical protein